MPLQKRTSRAVRDDSSADPPSDTEEQGRLNDDLLRQVDPTLLNQPVDLRQGDSKLKQLVGQLQVLKKSLKDTLILLHNVTSEFVETLAEEHRDEGYDEHKYLEVLLENSTFQQLDAEFKVVLDRVQENEIRTATISDLRQRIVQGHQITNIYETYQKKADRSLEEYQSTSIRDKLVKNKDYADFISLVWEQFTDGASVPNIKKFLPREDSNGAGAQAGAGGKDSDDEVEITAQKEDFRCPLTASYLEDAYTSTVCPHSFSGYAIKEYIQSNHGNVECPIGGCSKRLKLDTVERDQGLQRRVEGHLRRIKEGRSQNSGPGATQGAAGDGRTYVEMEDSSDDE
ncbi:SUMO ligase MMS21 [Sporobolomyces koalae]|uniref:SUMO ligase MMS21 n=1 Tax=Sporobolomyces koalae TaxID=500713 RepID=UPI00316C0AE1